MPHDRRSQPPSPFSAYFYRLHTNQFRRLASGLHLNTNGEERQLRETIKSYLNANASDLISNPAYAKLWSPEARARLQRLHSSEDPDSGEDEPLPSWLGVPDEVNVTDILL